MFIRASLDDEATIPDSEASKDLSIAESEEKNKTSVVPKLLKVIILFCLLLGAIGVISYFSSRIPVHLNTQSHSSDDLPLNRTNNTMTPRLPKHIADCLSKKPGNEYRDYLTIASMVRNKRQYIREWLEFHLMMGVSHFMIYDHHSDDRVDAILQPYVKDGLVTYIIWPPREIPSYEDWKLEDPLLEEHFRARMEHCIAYKEVISYHIPCQTAAFDHAIRETRGRTRWLAGVDVDEFYYIPQNSSIWGSHPEAPLRGAFEYLEDFDIVVMLGQQFGTNGWISPPRRGDNQEYAQLVTKSHPNRMQLEFKEFIGIAEIMKPFANPSCVYGNNLHDYFWDTANLPNINIQSMHHNTNFDKQIQIYCNHYVWPSYLENIEKVRMQGRSSTSFDPIDDQEYNKEIGEDIVYLLENLEQRVQQSHKIRPALDGHADDWDYTLQSKHMILPDNSSQSTDLCVIMMNPSHIGLARHATSSIINYFFRVEPNITYKLIIANADVKIQHELAYDFPVDQFLQTNSSLQIQQACPADYILKIHENSFPRWELWSVDKPVIKLSTQLLQDVQIDLIALSDSSNSLAPWNKGTYIDYRENSNHFNDVNTVLFMKIKDFTDDLSSKRIYELCLHQDGECPNNIVISLFDFYKQERMHGYLPAFSTPTTSDPFKLSR